MFENDYRPAGRTRPPRANPRATPVRDRPHFPVDRFGTVRAEPHTAPGRERYAIQIRRDGRPFWFIVVLNMPGPGEIIPYEDLRANNLDEWPIIYRPDVDGWA
jgi:hypothetical protein